MVATMEVIAVRAAAIAVKAAAMTAQIAILTEVMVAGFYKAEVCHLLLFSSHRLFCFQRTAQTDFPKTAFFPLWTSAGFWDVGCPYLADQQPAVLMC